MISRRNRQCLVVLSKIAKQFSLSFHGLPGNLQKLKDQDGDPILDDLLYPAGQDKPPPEPNQLDLGRSGYFDNLSCHKLNAALK
jgi:hypothetical protein